MALELQETPASRVSENSNSGTYELVYTSTGEFDDFAVQTYALDSTPTWVAMPAGVLYRQSVRVEPVAWKVYKVTVSYGKRDSSNLPSGEFSFSFDTTGATVNIKCAKSHLVSYPTDGDWHKGAINVKTDGSVDGCEIVIPGLKLSYAFKHPAGEVTETFARNLAAATGKINSDEWRGFQPGELLFAGGSGSDGTEAEAEVGYQFIASGNATGLSIGGITGIAKRGHDYAWVEFEEALHSGESVQRPKRVHVEAVYDPISFRDTLGWW